MNNSALTQNINKVEEMVLDEDKLVTYVSLSRELCLHVNECKSLLNETIKYIRNRRPDIKLKINYIICGISEGNLAHTRVCNGEEAVKLRENFFKVIFFDHVYSISKSVSEVDKVAYLAINRLEDISLCSGLINNSICTRHTSHEIAKLKSTSKTEPIEHKPVPAFKKNVSQNKKSIASNEKSEVNNPIIDMKKESPKKDLSTKPKLNQENKNTNASQKGIAGFFAKTNGNLGMKTNGNVKISPENKGDIAKQKLNEIKFEKMDEDQSYKSHIKDKDNKNLLKKEVSLNGDSQNDVPGKTKNSNGDKNDFQARTKSSKSINSSLSQITKNAKVETKRKRVLHVSDSESEDDKNDPFETETTIHNSDDEIPPTPSINTVKITSGIVNPKKRRKIIDKTYTDDEGYILTKKVEVYESCSENEEETSKESVKLVKKTERSPEIKRNDNKTKKKVTPPQKGKQSTLMNFFKKT